MQRIEEFLTSAVIKAGNELWGTALESGLIQIQKTRKDFQGDFTIVVFPLLRTSKKSPEQTGDILGKYLQENLPEVEAYNVIKGFLNLTISGAYWLEILKSAIAEENYGIKTAEKDAPTVMVEYSSPNTNKPLHLGHIRNNLLGFAVSQILEANGKNVVKVNLVNDRGIHICKSMVAWLKFGNGENPESSGKKGDKLVGDYYVRFDKEYKKQIEALKAEGVAQKEAEARAPIMEEARDMLRKWEADDEEVTTLWAKMNGWVYKGFDETYKNLGVSFDKIYYESQTYKFGRDLVLDGLKRGVLEKEDDGSIWADLTDRKLDRKLLLRSDGTSVYMTQDLGTAHQRFSEFDLEDHIYVVGNEQNYHFQVLSIILDKLGFDWSSQLYHLSYGMVELPEGKMKSREGTVVDADDLIEGMVATAKEMADELGKLSGYSEEEKSQIHRQIGLGALKYFILKVDPKRNMLFDPGESIDFNGNTGPFIQYTYARINSVLRNAGDFSQSLPSVEMNKEETDLVRLIYTFPEIIRTAGEEKNPSVVANYMYEMAKGYNQFYHDHSILSADSEEIRHFRILISQVTGKIIERGMALLGIEVPERM